MLDETDAFVDPYAGWKLVGAWLLAILVPWALVGLAVWVWWQ